MRFLTRCLFLINLLFLVYGISSHYYPKDEPKNTFSLWRITSQILLKQLLQRTHRFIPVDELVPQYGDRRMIRSSAEVDAVDFSCPYLSFHVQNATDIFISARRAGSFSSEHFHTNLTHRLFSSPQSFELNCWKRPFSSITAIIDNCKIFQFPNLSEGVLNVSLGQDSAASHQLDVSLVNAHEEETKKVQLDGIWIDKGAKLLTINDKIHDKKWQEDISRPSEPKSQPFEQFRLDIFGSLLDSSSWMLERDRNGSVASMNSTFVRLIEKLHIENLSIRSQQLPSRTCVTSRCAAPHTSTTIPSATAKDMYLQFSGRFDLCLDNKTHRHTHHHVQRPSPSAILLELGFWDFYIFLSNKANHNKAAINDFTSHFVTELVDFILIMRRTIQPQSIPGQHDKDASYAYNSLPSTTRILLSSPILPEPFDPLLQALLHKALVETVSRLRSEGDIQTFLIDTSGWLDISDYKSTLVPPSLPLSIEDIAAHGRRQSDAIETREIPVLNARGHRKLAYFLSLHLCSHIRASGLPKEDKKIRCAFEAKSNRYTGSLYVPDEAALNILIEERKIERAKGLVEWE